MFTKSQVKELIESRQQIERLLERARGMKTIATGTVSIETTTDVAHASTKINDVIKQGDKLQSVAILPMKMKRFKNEIICILQGDGVHLPVRERYVGISKCHKDDEFNLSVGCTIAQTRAMVKAYKRRLEITEQILGGTHE